MSTKSPARVGDLFVWEQDGGYLVTQVVQVDEDGVVEFVGYGDNRLITSHDDLVSTGRSLFFKVSYAYQR